MKRKTLLIILSLEAVAFIGTYIFNVTLKNAFTSITTFPFEQIGTGLRALSLSGVSGNIIALLIYMCLSILPIAYLLYRIFKKTNKVEDILLVVLSVLLFKALYLLINPAYLNSMFPMGGISTMGKVILCGTMYSVIIGYIVLKLLRKFVLSEAKKLLDYLNVLMVILCLLLVYSIFGEGTNGLLSTIKTVKLGNTEMTSLLSTTYFFLVVRFILTMLPTALTIVIIFFVNALVEELKSDRYSEAVIHSAHKLGSMCKISVAIMMISYIVTNLVQLIFGKYMLNSHYTAQIPLFSIILVLFALLLAKYSAESKALKSDNDMFI